MADVVAVVGGSGGLGSVISEVLAAGGGRHVLVGYASNGSAAAAVVERITAKGGAASSASVDVREAESVEAFLDLAAGLGPRLAGVVNAVGPPIPLRPLVEVSAAEFRAIMDTDVSGAFNVLTAASRRLAAKGGGAIVQLLTTAVLRTLENDGMSGIPKTAVMGIVRQLAREVGAANVRVNAVAPGVIDAGIVHSSFTTDDVARGVIELCLQRTPMPRMGLPEEVAGVVAFLLDNAYVNGQIVGVDGGYSA